MPIGVFYGEIHRVLLVRAFQGTRITAANEIVVGFLTSGTNIRSQAPPIAYSLPFIASTRSASIRKSIDGVFRFSKSGVCEGRAVCLGRGFIGQGKRVPVRIDELQFDEWNESEFARHAVTEREVRQVFDDEATLFFPNRKTRRSPLLMIGVTHGAGF